MRVIVLWCVLTGACMLAGWPGHWVLAAVSFLAGMIAVWRPSHGADRDRRGGYLPPPAANQRTVTQRVYDYAGERNGDHR